MNRIILAVLFSALVVPASAHTGHAEMSGFVAGALHPFGGADHVLAMVAAGLWAGISGGRAVLIWPAAFLAAMLGGFAAARFGVTLPMVETVVAVSVAVLGFKATFGVRLPTVLGAAISGLFAIFHGAAHGIEMPADAAVFAYSSGFTLSTAMLLGAGIAAVRFGRVARVAAGCAAASGLGLLFG